MKKAKGAIVADVVEDSPAAKAGVAVGDVIMRFGDHDIDNAKSLSRVVADTDPKDRVPLRVWRNGDEKTLHVTLGESEDDAEAAAQVRSGGSAGANLGLELADLNAEYRNRLGLSDDVEGVVVTGVQPGSAADLQGLQPGDVISRINSTEIHDVGDAARATKAAGKHGGHATLLVRRGDVQQFVSVALS